MKERLRLCIGCHKLYNTNDLIKIKTDKNKLFINPEFYLSGRSAYLCYNMECIFKIRKNRKLEKSFKNKIKITDKTWQILSELLQVKQKNLSLVLERIEGN
jgi:predicted RNA-binding protein YlxR (DUF448 family)